MFRRKIFRRNIFRRNFFCEVFVRQKIIRRTNFSAKQNSRTIFRLKTFSTIFFSSENVFSRNSFRPKSFSPEKVFGRTFFRPKKFRLKISGRFFFSAEKFPVNNIFGWKIFRPIFFGQKYFPQKREWLNFIGKFISLSELGDIGKIQSPRWISRRRRPWGGSFRIPW